MEIKKGSYWRDKRQRGIIDQVGFLFSGRVIHVYDVLKKTHSSFSISTPKAVFLEKYEPLNRLEVLILFGEYIEDV